MRSVAQPSLLRDRGTTSCKARNKHCILDSEPSCSTCAICKSIILPSLVFCSAAMSAVFSSCPHVTQMRILRGQRAVNIRALAEGNLLLELPYRDAFTSAGVSGLKRMHLAARARPIGTANRERRQATACIRDGSISQAHLRRGKCSRTWPVPTVSVRGRRRRRRLEENSPPRELTIASHRRSAFCLSDVPVPPYLPLFPPRHESRHESRQVGESFYPKYRDPITRGALIPAPAEVLPNAPKTAKMSLFLLYITTISF